MKENLIIDGEESDQKEETKYFIERYNDVIETYNENAAKTPGFYLEIMHVNPFFKKVN